MWSGKTALCREDINLVKGLVKLSLNLSLYLGLKSMYNDGMNGALVATFGR
jgi:hypothetical protein